MKKRARAVIIKGRKVLTIKRTKPERTYWVIPGGGVQAGETNEQAIIREAKEELGLDVHVRDLILELDSKKLETKGQKDLFYRCDILGGILGSGQGPEFDRNSVYVGRYDIEWVDLVKLKEINLLPLEIKELLIKLNLRKTTKP